MHKAPKDGGEKAAGTARMGRIGERPYWALMGSLGIRAAHQVGAAVFLTIYLLDAAGPLPRLYLHIALVSGALLFLTEWLRHRQICREFAGLMTLTKIALMGAAYHGLLPPAETVLAAFVMASIGTHAPKQVRHRLLY